MSVTRHLGIRYATAARFEAPVMVPFDPSAGPFDTAGKLAPQVPGMMENMLGIDVGDMSEDCLFLNVFAPADAEPASKLPVLYWIHGGAYLNGGGSIAWYDGSALAARGHVVVTINYRLGALGFLGAGNWGTLDQICGLRWVREHIAQFGGDPGNVTLWGESGGGGKINCLMAMPAAKGLFHKAIVESGSTLRIGSREEGTAEARKLLDKLGLRPDQLEQLRQIPPARLYSAGVTGAPVVDGVTIPSQIWDPKAPEICQEPRARGVGGLRLTSATSQSPSAVSPASLTAVERSPLGIHGGACSSRS